LRAGCKLVARRSDSEPCDRPTVRRCVKRLGVVNCGLGACLASIPRPCTAGSTAGGAGRANLCHLTAGQRSCVQNCVHPGLPLSLTTLTTTCSLWFHMVCQLRITTRRGSPAVLVLAMHGARPPLTCRHGQRCRCSDTWRVSWDGWRADVCPEWTRMHRLRHPQRLSPPSLGSGC